MSAQQAMNNLIGTATAGAIALSHIHTQNKMAKDLGELKKGQDSYAAKIADDNLRQKAAAIAEQRQKKAERMAGGVFNDKSRQMAANIVEQRQKKTEGMAGGIFKDKSRQMAMAQNSENLDDKGVRAAIAKNYHSKVNIENLGKLSDDDLRFIYDEATHPGASVSIPVEIPQRNFTKEDIDKITTEMKLRAKPRPAQKELTPEELDKIFDDDEGGK